MTHRCWLYMHPKIRFIDQYDLILLDLMDTLMFGGNRFSAREDYDKLTVNWVVRTTPTPTCSAS